MPSTPSMRSCVRTGCLDRDWRRWEDTWASGGIRPRTGACRQTGAGSRHTISGTRAGYPGPGAPLSDKPSGARLHRGFRMSRPSPDLHRRFHAAASQRPQNLPPRASQGPRRAGQPQGGRHALSLRPECSEGAVNESYGLAQQLSQGSGSYRRASPTSSLSARMRGPVHVAASSGANSAVTSPGTSSNTASMPSARAVASSPWKPSAT